LNKWTIAFFALLAMSIGSEARSWTGTASYYALKGLTASGGRAGSLTAAHRTLPFGTKVRVTNLSNHRSVVVTVTDRGPFTGSRVIDVSTQAADRLGFRGAGVARVRVETISPSPPTEMRSSPEAKSTDVKPGAAKSPETKTIERGLAESARETAGAACLAKMKDMGAAAETALSPDAPLDGCGIAVPVRLRSVAVDGQRDVAFLAKPLLDCAYALQLAGFVKTLVAPLGFASMMTPLIVIDSGPGYECRGRNRDPQAQVSAHGKGLALDLSAFVFEGGRRIAVESQTDAAATAFVKTLRMAACGWFTTVLGPGSDASHANHLHLDIERHGSSDRYRICQ
jgi:hypothetical protein